MMISSASAAGFECNTSQLCAHSNQRSNLRGTFHRKAAIGCDCGGSVFDVLIVQSDEDVPLGCCLWLRWLWDVFVG